MKKELFVPACHQYIKNKDGTPNIQRIFSVAKSAYQSKYPKQLLNDNELFAFLQASHVIPAEAKEEELDTEHTELCFSVISQYKCNSICQLCAYSPLYKNQFEIQESILIGYALTSWKNLQNLLNSGITCRHFRAMIPVSENSAVMVVPLNRLAFEYLEKIPKSQTDLLSVTDKIIISLKENNKDKLSAADLKIAKKFLDNLYNSNFQNLESKEIDRILKECFQLSYCEIDNADVPSQTISKEKPGPKAACLEGLLTGKQNAVPVNRNMQKEVPRKNTSAKNSPKGNPTFKKPLIPTENPTHKLDSTKKEIISSEPKLDITASYTQEKDCQKLIDTSDNLLERTPLAWECPQDAFLHISSINLDNADSAQIQLFLNQLLITPILPMEIVNYQKKEVALIYTGKQFFYYSKSNLIILDALLPYIEKSRFRKILCYEPYELYAYFHQQQCHSVQIFSLRLAMDFTCPAHLWNCAPDLIFKEHLQVEIPVGEATVIHIMKHYQMLYGKAIDMLRKIEPKRKSDYQEKYYLSLLLGYSYHKEVYSSFKGRLFSKETLTGFAFTYSPKEKMVSPYKAVCFQIHWNSKECFPVEALLAKIVEHKVPEKHNIFLLAFKRNCISFAVTDAEYNYCCELVNHLSSYFAEKRNKLPVHIDEGIWNDMFE